LKRILSSIFIGLLLYSNVIANSSVTIKEINKDWKFRQAGTIEWYGASVPGCVHTDLINNKKIDDPNYRVNEKKLQWIGEKDWEYRTEFTVDASTLQKDNVNMVFKGLDTYADVYLNDSLILRTNNMHREWVKDCKSVLLPGKNTLRIYFSSIFKVNMPKYLASPFKLQAWQNNDQSDIWLSLYARKAGFHFGWDWGPRLITCGIWRPIFIESWNSARINNVQMLQNNVSANSANLTAIFEIYSNQSQSATLTVLNDKTSLCQKQVSIKSGINRIPVEFIIKNPKLWWSNGLGKANLYAFDCCLKTNGVEDSKIINTGIRSLKIVRQADAQGKSMYVLLNGIPVFMKGSNYIPLDNFQNRVTAEKYEYYIKSAAESNMNMLRVWGGGIYEEDTFYDLCDKYGILVWQDIMFACGMFPVDDEFVQTVKQEVSQNVKRLRNHPCIALWNGNNENEISWFGWGWKSLYNDQDQKTYLTNLEYLFYNIVPNAINESDTTRYYHPTSPNTGYNNISKSNGDVHYWDTKGDAPLTSYNTFIGRFMSEYGFQSYPDMKSIEKFTIQADRNKTSEVMFSHNRAKDDNTGDPNFGNNVIEKKMKVYYKIPDKFESYVYMSQILHAKATKIAIEAHRRNMPYCMGTLMWQLDDCWPAVSWSSIDFYGTWKAAQYTIRDAYKTIIVPVIIEDGKLRVYIVSDSLNEVKAHLSFNVIDFKGENLFSKQETISISPNSSKVYFEFDTLQLYKQIDKRNSILYVQVKEGEKQLASNNFNFVPEKDMLLSRPKIEVTDVTTGEESFITLKSDVLAKNVYLSYPNVEGFFSDNYFDIIPGEVKKVTFTPKRKTEEKRQTIQVKSLFDF
jgi:beta-mannosidase